MVIRGMVYYCYTNITDLVEDWDLDSDLPVLICCGHPGQFQGAAHGGAAADPAGKCATSPAG